MIARGRGNLTPGAARGYRERACSIGSSRRARDSGTRPRRGAPRSAGQGARALRRLRRERREAAHLVPRTFWLSAHARGVRSGAARSSPPLAAGRPRLQAARPQRPAGAPPGVGSREPALQRLEGRPARSARVPGTAGRAARPGRVRSGVGRARAPARASARRPTRPPSRALQSARRAASPIASCTAVLARPGHAPTTT